MHLVNKFKQHFFTPKFLSFFVIGVWNTIFGIGLFFLLYSLLHKYCYYMVLVVIANVITITNAYILYKFFVFKTKGNYLKEYMKFYVVYGLAFVVSILVFPIFMEIILPFVQAHMLNYSNIFQYKAYIAQLCTAAVTMFVSYFGHNRFSFRCSISSEVF